MKTVITLMGLFLLMYLTTSCSTVKEVKQSDVKKTVENASKSDHQTETTKKTDTTTETIIDETIEYSPQQPPVILGQDLTPNNKPAQNTVKIHRTTRTVTKTNDEQVQTDKKVSETRQKEKTQESVKEETVTEPHPIWAWLKWTAIFAVCIVVGFYTYKAMGSIFG